MHLPAISSVKVILFIIDFFVENLTPWITSSADSAFPVSCSRENEVASTTSSVAEEGVFGNGVNPQPSYYNNTA